jgi:NAD(P)-dependent dehydrogenase (short-subunit alcohol dehydrogenase family)
MKKLEDKVAVITGGSSGIGLATARRLVDEGAHVVITGRREEELKAAAAAIGTNITTVGSDVSRLEDLDRLYAVVKEKHGHIDILFANAGAGAGTIAPLTAATEVHFDQTFDVNVKGLFFTVQKALPLFKDGGSIILNSSVSNVLGLPGFSAYAASKAAVRNFARAWTLELKDRGIRVNSMSPGPTETPALETTAGLPPNRPSKQRANSLRKSRWVAGVNQRKSQPPSRSSPPTRALSLPAWTSPSMGAWPRSDPVTVQRRAFRGRHEPLFSPQSERKIGDSS